MKLLRAFRRVARSSLRGVALLTLLISFTLLSLGMFYGGSTIALLLAAVTMVASIAMFRKIKPLENQG